MPKLNQCTNGQLTPIKPTDDKKHEPINFLKFISNDNLFFG